MANGPITWRDDSRHSSPPRDHRAGREAEQWRRAHRTALVSAHIQRDAARVRANVEMDPVPLAHEIRRRWGLSGAPGGYRFHPSLPLFHGYFPRFSARPPSLNTASGLWKPRPSADAGMVSVLARKPPPPVAWGWAKIIDAARSLHHPSTAATRLARREPEGSNPVQTASVPLYARIHAQRLGNFRPLGHDSMPSRTWLARELGMTGGAILQAVNGSSPVPDERLLTVIRHDIRGSSLAGPATQEIPQQSPTVPVQRLAPGPVPPMVFWNQPRSAQDSPLSRLPGLLARPHAVQQTLLAHATHTLPVPPGVSPLALATPPHAMRFLHLFREVDRAGAKAATGVSAAMSPPMPVWGWRFHNVRRSDRSGTVMSSIPPVGAVSFPSQAVSTVQPATMAPHSASARLQRWANANPLVTATSWPMARPAAAKGEGVLVQTFFRGHFLARRSPSHPGDFAGDAPSPGHVLPQGARRQGREQVRHPFMSLPPFLGLMPLQAATHAMEAVGTLRRPSTRRETVILGGYQLMGGLGPAAATGSTVAPSRLWSASMRHHEMPRRYSLQRSGSELQEPRRGLGSALSRGAAWSMVSSHPSLPSGTSGAMALASSQLTAGTVRLPAVPLLLHSPNVVQPVGGPAYAQAHAGKNITSPPSLRTNPVPSLREPLGSRPPLLRHLDSGSHTPSLAFPATRPTGVNVRGATVPPAPAGIQGEAASYAGEALTAVMKSPARAPQTSMGILVQDHVAQRSALHPQLTTLDRLSGGSSAGGWGGVGDARVPMHRMSLGQPHDAPALRLQHFDHPLPAAISRLSAPPPFHPSTLPSGHPLPVATARRSAMRRIPPMGEVDASRTPDGMIRPLRLALQTRQGSVLTRSRSRGNSSPWPYLKDVKMPVSRAGEASLLTIEPQIPLGLELGRAVPHLPGVGLDGFRQGPTGAPRHVSSRSMPLTITTSGETPAAVADQWPTASNMQGVIQPKEATRTGGSSSGAIAPSLAWSMATTPAPLLRRLQPWTAGLEQAPTRLLSEVAHDLPLAAPPTTPRQDRSIRQPHHHDAFVQTSPQPLASMALGTTTMGREGEAEGQQTEIGGSQSPIDLDELVEKAWQKLLHKLTIEQERRGYSR